MGSITGTGCQLSGMMTAYLVANPDEPLKAAAAAVCAMGLAGEIGWSHMKPEDGNSTYRNRIIDASTTWTARRWRKVQSMKCDKKRPDFICCDRPQLAERRDTVQPGGKGSAGRRNVYPAPRKKS